MSPVFRALLLITGATPANSYVEVGQEAITFRLGHAFRKTIARSLIESVREPDEPMLMGLGTRTRAWPGLFRLVVGTGGLVELRLREKVRLWRWFPCDRIAVTLTDPRAFIDALER